MEQHDLSKIQKLQEKGKSDKIIKYLSSSDDTVVVAALEALSRIKDEDRLHGTIAGHPSQFPPAADQ